MDLNTIYQCDVLDGLKYLQDESIDLIITSPPYNKGGINKNKHNRSKCKWNRVIEYNGSSDSDDMDEDAYQQWQIEILNECYRVLKDDGSMFYNHKNRIVYGTGEIISPYKWLFKTPFKVRQEIIWDRCSTPNLHNSRYYPTTEKIFWLTKTERPRFIRNAMFPTEVWRFQFKKNTEHPAPFPLELPNNIIPSIALGERITVLDPFMGSGTVAISAIKNGCNYIGFDKYQEYVDMANNRIKMYMDEQKKNSNFHQAPTD